MKIVLAGHSTTLSALAGHIVRIASFGLSSRIAGYLQVRRRVAQYRDERISALPVAQKNHYQSKLRSVCYA